MVGGGWFRTSTRPPRASPARTTCSRPLVWLSGEADCPVGAAMISFLTQLRAGYLARDESPFPHSAVLIGRREVRSFILAPEERVAVSWLGTASPFNISAEATTIGP